MYYVYILQSEKDERLYVGYTQDLKRRLKEHNRGKTNSLKPRRPLNLLYYEEKRTLKEAIKKEKHFKTGWEENI